MKPIFHTIALLATCMAASAIQDTSLLVSVTGGANAPGYYAMEPTDNLWTIMQKAHGPGRFWTRRITIVRKTNNDTEVINHEFGKLKSGLITEQQYWESISVRPGDTIYLHEIAC